MLDAMVGFSRLSPISVAPPWPSALAAVDAAGDAKGLRVAYVSDIAGIGVDPEIDAICRQAALSLREAGATVEEISFDVSDGKSPYQAWRGLCMVGQHYPELAHLGSFGANLRGNVEAGLKVTPLDVAKAERGRIALFHRVPQAVRSFRRAAHPGRAGEAVPGRDEFSDRDQRHEARELHRLDRAGVPGHAGEPAGRQRAGRPDRRTGCRSGCRSSRRGSRSR